MLLAAANAADVWAPVRFFEGKWEGKASGQPGTGTTSRECRFELGGRFLVCKNHAVYALKPGKPEPEVHEDWGVFSYDKSAKAFILRQFHAEGFVNEYAGTVAPDGRQLEFVSRAIENIAPGWRAREAYRIEGPDEFVEVFSLAAPGKEFERLCGEPTEAG